MNEERFSTMPTEEFLELAGKFNELDRARRESASSAIALQRELEAINNAIGVGAQFTANDLLAKIHEVDWFKSSRYRDEKPWEQWGGDDIIDAFTKAEARAAAIVDGFNDRRPSETYQMVLDYGKQALAIIKQAEKQAQDRINELVKGDGVVKSE